MLKIAIGLITPERKLKRITRFLIWLPAAFMLLSSCVSTKKTPYFRGLEDGVYKTSYSAPLPVIHKNDLLSIFVASGNKESDQLYNAPNVPVTTSSSGNNTSQQTVGYLVNEDGNIQFPKLGMIKVEGWTVKELTDNLTDSLTTKKLLLEPVITVRFLNFRVTVLGEVGTPKVITVPNEKITLLEAIGLAGDLTIYGKRENVLLIREEEGKRIVHRIDLNDPLTLTSPFYYLKSNDVIYVEPDANKVASVSNFRQLIPTILAFITLLVVIVDRVGHF